MALSKKDKLLQAAQKNIQKGQWLKAAKDFQKVLELDPKDIRCRQRLAELLNRAGLAKESFEAYEKVAKNYADNGFYLKAIAVYKQMQKIDPSQERIYRRLGQLNEKQGLVGNALGEYRQLADIYEKSANISELHEILEKMKELDPENSGLRLRLCRSYLKNGLVDNAHAELRDALVFLEKIKDPEVTGKFKELVAFYLAEDIEIKIEIGRILLLCERPEEARVLLCDELEKHPDHRDILPVLAQAYRQKGEFDSEKELYARLLVEDPEQIDYQEGFVRACLDQGDAREALDRLEEWKGNFLERQRAAVLKDFYEQLQVLCEGDERVRQTLHVVYENTGEGAKLFDLLSAGEESGHGGGAADDESSDAANEWFGDDLLDGAGDASVQSEACLPAGEEDVDPLLEESPAFEVDEVDEAAGSMDMPFQVEESQTAEMLEPEGSFADPFMMEDDAGLELEIEIELEGFDDTVEPMTEMPEANLCETGGEDAVPDFQSDFDADVFDPGFEEEVDASEAPALEAPGGAEDTPTSTLEENDPIGTVDDCLADLEQELGAAFDMDSFDLEDDDEPDLSSDLEETEFYLQQNFLDEALQKCRSLLDAHPQCREAAELLQKIEDRMSLDSEAPAAQPLPQSTPVEPAAKESAGGTASREKSRFEGNLSAFRKGIEDAVDKDDCETHFNLGIAYKEMGLLDEAIDAFNHAMAHSSRYFDALTLIGLCLASKGDFEQAAELFKTGLQQEGLSGGIASTCSSNWGCCM